MKKIILSKITMIVLLVLSVAFLGFYVYMIARPISYEMAYTNSAVYEGETFESETEFYADSTTLTKNSAFKDGVKSYYYYKNGYVFSIVAFTEEGYQEEVEKINADFEGAVNKPFYASKINAFKFEAVGPDGYSLTYTCTPAIVFAIVGGVVELMLIGVTISVFVLSKKR